MNTDLQQNNNSERYTLVFNDTPRTITPEPAKVERITNKILINTMLWVGGIIALMIAIDTLIN